MIAKSIAAAAVLASLATAAQSAPLASAGAEPAPVRIEKVQYRGCWWEDGYRVCGGYGPRVYGWYGSPYAWRSYRSRNPDDYRTGSKRWWDEMEREDRAGSGGR